MPFNSTRKPHLTGAAPIPAHGVIPKTKLSAATFGRVGSCAPEPFALAQEDETMQANIKCCSTGKLLLSRLTLPLDCQVQSSVLPAQGSLDIPTISWERPAIITQIRGKWKPPATISNAFVITSCLGQGRSHPHMLMQRLAPTRELLITTAIRSINVSVPRKIQISLTALHCVLPSNETANY